MTTPHWPELLDDYAAEEFEITFQADTNAYIEFLEGKVAQLAGELEVCRGAIEKYASGDE